LRMSIPAIEWSISSAMREEAEPDPNVNLPEFRSLMSENRSCGVQRSMVAARSIHIIWKELA